MELRPGGQRATRRRPRAWLVAAAGLAIGLRHADFDFVPPSPGRPTGSESDHSDCVASEGAGAGASVPEEAGPGLLVDSLLAPGLAGLATGAALTAGSTALWLSGGVRSTVSSTLEGILLGARTTTSGEVLLPWALLRVPAYCMWECVSTALFGAATAAALTWCSLRPARALGPPGDLPGGGL